MNIFIIVAFSLGTAFEAAILCSELGLRLNVCIVAACFMATFLLSLYFIIKIAVQNAKK